MYVTDEHALSAPARDGAAVTKELRDRTEITDALYRFALGQDLKDRRLFASAFAEDAELDFRPAAAKWGAKPPLMVGRDTIVTTILGMFTGRVDTTHQITNPRITIDGDTARLTALVEAQHLLTADHSKHALLKTPYAVDLVRHGASWAIQRLHIDNTWYTGDPADIFGSGE
ncbi:nuclear transport factor 2 family protein [Streptomyces lunaelactis]|uniref:nuclear transport factor 2 family protein n=1 Tax=Streptomyces lunaelactis TaxID=1535768 RepID=UPI0015847CA3|nr:nuclear transport factor 2 family protein [Streptomyces lunaelactis]NUK62844.1 nuclear transport factor 2 family protein [Streptomyces lunaelactis]